MSSSFIKNTREDILTPAELACRYKVSSRTVLNWAQRGSVPAIRVGKVVRFRLSDVAAALEGWPTVSSSAVKGRG